MLEALSYPFDAEFILQNRRKLKKELLSDGSARTKKRIALLGGATTGIIRPILELFLLDAGVGCVCTGNCLPSYLQPQSVLATGALRRPGFRRQKA